MHHFFAYLAKLKHIKRWGLMRNALVENVQEHTTQVAWIAHALAVLRNKRLPESVDAYKVLCYALYHESGEVIVGDLATPIKYHNPQIRDAFAQLETLAVKKVEGFLPEDLRPVYHPWLEPDKDSEEWKLCKAADRIAAYIKCVEEMRAGNHEFEHAMAKVEKSIRQMEIEEVKVFMALFAPSFALTLDELNQEAD